MSLHLGLDLGGTNVKCVVLRDGEVVARAQVATRSDEGPDAVLARVARLGRETAARVGVPATAGLGLPGHFDPQTGSGVLLPNLRGDWVGQPIAAPVGEAIGLPVALINDVRALTLAELRLGAGRGARDLVCIALGTGVGGGVVVDGRLHLGLAHAGELGHQTIDRDGPACGCGNRGCLDRMAGADAVAELAGQPTVEAAIAAARRGDERAVAGFAEAAERIAVGIGNAISILWPERVVVGGGVAAAGDVLFEPLRAAVRRRAACAPAIPLVPAALGAHAGAAGAALWAAEQAAVSA